MKTKPTKEPTTESDVIKAVSDNHIWINAFSLINPSDETALSVGRSVIAMLQDKPRLLPKYTASASELDADGKRVMQKMAELTPMLYMSVNAS